MNLCAKSRFMRQNVLGGFLRFASTAPEIDQNDQVIVADDEDTMAREAEIERKRNISRLMPAHRNQLHGRQPYEEPQCSTHLTLKYHRKLYGKYGIASGVNPSLCWPTKAEIQETFEYEAVAYPYTIKEMMEVALKKKKEEQIAIEKREAEIAVKYAKLEQWKKELHDKIAKKTAEVKNAKDKKERLVEEVRRHFGFKLDPRDERFQEMLAKREKEQKKLERLLKKETKEKIMIAKLQQQNVEISGTTNK